jgi:hypothetical protein
LTVGDKNPRYCQHASMEKMYDWSGCPGHLTPYQHGYARADALVPLGYIALVLLLPNVAITNLRQSLLDCLGFSFGEMSPGPGASVPSGERRAIKRKWTVDEDHSSDEIDRKRSRHQPKEERRAGTAGIGRCDRHRGRQLGNRLMGVTQAKKGETRPDSSDFCLPRKTCVFCGATGHYRFDDSEMRNPDVKLHHCRHWKTRGTGSSTCTYSECLGRGHLTWVCPILHGLCLRCGFRGHLAKLCHLSSTVDRFSSFEKQAVNGKFTGTRHDDMHWGFFGPIPGNGEYRDYTGLGIREACNMLGKSLVY